MKKFRDIYDAFIESLDSLYYEGYAEQIGHENPQARYGAVFANHGSYLSSLGAVVNRLLRVDWFIVKIHKVDQRIYHGLLSRYGF